MEEDWTGLLFTPCAETKEGRSYFTDKLCRVGGQMDISRNTKTNRGINILGVQQ